ncbi:unnamed protein product [Fraxinus pennsylvanica]|uniref:BZIP domain-containing protein n=1 Tax=Fraxinus pennsylvanica TaxID=56036 RepID=A0AAD1YSY5_9LAMI|nr:unnamed protein product [Fraxinus pennsylvanica]
MEPINTNAENLEFHQGVDDQLENVMLQDFNKFREKMTLSNSDGAIDFEHLVDLYITHGHGSDNSDLSQSTRDQFTALLQDFNMFENTMLPPYQVESTNMHNKNDLNKTNIETQESEMMVNEMAGVTSLDATGSCPNTFTSMKITSHNDTNGESIIRYSNMTCYRADAGGSGILLGPFTRYFRAQHGGRMNFLPWAGGNAMASTSTSRRKRIKRKYRGVIETEEETACRLEQTKIKNREAAAKAQDNKKAREASLWTHLLKLRRKNKFRKNLITFLEGHERINLLPKPFRRTISGPI